jgi:hypothetical protein
MDQKVMSPDVGFQQLISTNQNLGIIFSHNQCVLHVVGRRVTKNLVAVRQTWMCLPELLNSYTQSL